ncbi:MbtH family protein [Serratia rubidaea]|uniref:MbtH family protein n=1 Tax=Serratia rubidaea TaxID=61652 RepID=UPI0022B8D7C2|nr:MbtH family protein [Serratia rubidaea]WBF45731.1 MbtH family protein [Serratia rubidaea]
MATFLGEDDTVQCTVVINARKQYSIWPVGKDAPSGWEYAGFKGTRAACLDYIAEVWADPTASD